MTTQRTLFPDILEQLDPFGRQRQSMAFGHACWTLGTDARCRGTCSDYRHVVVLYDEERWLVHPTGLHWRAGVLHYRNRLERHTTGWGSSRRTAERMVQHTHETLRKFATREEAIELAWSLASIMKGLTDDDT